MDSKTTKLRADIIRKRLSMRHEVGSAVRETLDKLTDEQLSRSMIRRRKVKLRGSQNRAGAKDEGEDMNTELIVANYKRKRVRLIEKIARVDAKIARISEQNRTYSNRSQR